MKDRYYYKDFITGERKFTRGEFIGWAQNQGPLKAPYAMFCNCKSTIAVPEYCLDRKTKQLCRSIAYFVNTHRFADIGETVLPAEIEYGLRVVSEMLEECKK